MDTLKGFLIPPFADGKDLLADFLITFEFPQQYDIMLLALFAATAGSGGLGNLAISNWVRDKGFGMAAHSGGFGGVLRHDRQQLAAVGQTFEITETHMKRWRVQLPTKADCGR